jgi:hypothetical protein
MEKDDLCGLLNKIWRIKPRKNSAIMTAVVTYTAA